VQSGNDFWPVLLVWVLGGLILYKLRRLHIPLAFLAAYLPLVYLRHLVTDRPFLAELGPVTWPMFQLYIFFMITDPRTTTKARWSQCAVAVLVAVADTVLRLAFREVHALYYALFIVAPITNLIEIAYDRRRAAAKQREAGLVMAAAAPNGKG
jgi:Na+-translocating ferredoxin:NAD+ oxidoreductase RnfD subunit